MGKIRTARFNRFFSVSLLLTNVTCVLNNSVIDRFRTVKVKKKKLNEYSRKSVVRFCVVTISSGTVPKQFGYKRLCAQVSLTIIYHFIDTFNSLISFLNLLAFYSKSYDFVPLPLPWLTVGHRYPTLLNVTTTLPNVTDGYWPLPNRTVTCVTSVTLIFKYLFKRPF